jgi:hypothetical protein
VFALSRVDPSANPFLFPLVGLLASLVVGIKLGYAQALHHLFPALVMGFLGLGFLRVSIRPTKRAYISLLAMVVIHAIFLIANLILFGVLQVKLYNVEVLTLCSNAPNPTTCIQGAKIYMITHFTAQAIGIVFGIVFQFCCAGGAFKRFKMGEETSQGLLTSVEEEEAVNLTQDVKMDVYEKVAMTEEDKTTPERVSLAPRPEPPSNSPTVKQKVPKADFDLE